MSNISMTLFGCIPLPFLLRRSIHQANWFFRSLKFKLQRICYRTFCWLKWMNWHSTLYCTINMKNIGKQFEKLFIFSRVFLRYFPSKPTRLHFSLVFEFVLKIFICLNSDVKRKTNNFVGIAMSWAKRRRKMCRKSIPDLWHVLVRVVCVCGVIEKEGDWKWRSEWNEPKNVILS